MTVRCLFPRDQEPHAQPRVRPRELSKHQEQRTLAPFPKAGREIGARCLGSPFTAQRPSLCAMWSICSMARALSGIQVQGAASLREQTQNSTEPRQSHSSFTSDKAHLDKTGRSMWTRLVTHQARLRSKTKIQCRCVSCSQAEQLPCTVFQASHSWRQSLVGCISTGRNRLQKQHPSQHQHRNRRSKCPQAALHAALG